MNTPFERKPAAQPRPNSKTRSNPKRRGSRVRKSGSAEGRFQQAQVSQGAQKNYERYLALARAEVLTGDRIMAENYFQHADHYFRSMHQNSH